MHWYLDVLKKYTVFDGRATRSEYWYYYLFNLIISIILTIIDSIGGFNINSNIGILASIYGLAVLLPSLGVLIRRLHDTDHSGWWFFIAFIPLAGIIWLIVYLVRDSDAGTNRYGPSPKATATTTA